MPPSSCPHRSAPRPPGRRGSRAPREGWTIVELVIALAVLGLLAGIAVPLFGSYQDRARLAKAVQDMRIIEAAVERYMAEFQRVPNRIESVVDPVPLDPWGNPYQYLKLLDAPTSARSMARKDKNLVPLNTDFDLYSKGKDGDSQAPLTAPSSKDDIIRANDGGYVGLAEKY